MTEKEIDALVERLFTNGANEKADRLLLIQEDHKGSARVANARDLGGWGKGPVRDAIRDAVRDAETRKTSGLNRETLRTMRPRD
jgi:hypothetical protein